MSTRTAVGLAAILALVGCQERERKLPPARSFTPPEPVPSEVIGGGEQSLPRGGSDPHAGLDMDDPHAGLDMDDPHAGLDMDDPHAGIDMDSEVGLDGEPPDPDRPIDDSKFLRGRIRANPDVKDAVEPGAIVFLSAWPINPATGEVLGSPMAVERLEIDRLPIEFRLDETHMMVKGTEFAGEVVVVAHVDGDGEARTKEPGDVEGRARAKVPQSDIDLVLDTILR